MRIAQVAPLYESVPPRKYGGIERVVYNLCESLVARGHEVTLFASADSDTSADLVPVVRGSLRLSKRPRDPRVWEILQLMELERQAGKFDVIHFHTDLVHFPIARRIMTPHVTTIHGRLDSAELQVFFQEFQEAPLISISESQRRALPAANWVATVYNGTSAEGYTLREHSGDYLAFLGRVAPDKGPDDAIEIALRAGMPLKMAAKIDPVDRAYFAERIEPLLEHPLIDFVGEVDERGKDDLLGNARALLFPIKWPEPFGLVMTEAMACGTPVIAYRAGSVEEVMRDGVSGYIVESLDEAVQALQKVDQIDRRRCREYFEERFSVEQMTRGYLAAYDRLLASSMPPGKPYARTTTAGSSTLEVVDDAELPAALCADLSRSGQCVSSDERDTRGVQEQIAPLPASSVSATASREEPDE
jgi:glycosyltransferase involved in cell wall biosynthesis